MTNIIFSDEVHKDYDSDDLENILRSLVDENSVCKMGGQDHSFTGKVKIRGLSSKRPRLKSMGSCRRLFDNGLLGRARLTMCNV